MKTMYVVAIEGKGGPEEAFKCREEPFPIPRDDEVVIRVFATGVNKLDISRTRLKYNLPRHWNHLPGLECTGTIIDIGKDVQQWKIGDQVCALLNGGGFAQAVAVRATQVLPLPLDDKFVMRRVACLPHAACTTWEAIIRLGKLSANMTLLVFERCGKFFDLAVQLAEMVQASVIIAIDESTSEIKSCSHAILDHNSPHFIEDVLKANGDKRVDLILDNDIFTVEMACSLLKIRGTIVLVDLEPKILKTLDLVPLFHSNAVLHVVDRIGWSPEYMAEVVSDMKENMWPAFSNGSLVLPEDPKDYLLSEAAKAHKFCVLTPV